MSTVKGFVKNIVFRNEENGYSVIELSENGSELTVVGTMPAAEIGDMLECEGEKTSHQVYGEQFKASAYHILPPENAANMERYLASGAVKGVGAAMASRIVEKFGDDTFRVMEEEPERLASVKGISLKKARDIGLSMQEKKSTRAPLVFLQSYGIGGATAIKIVKKYGEEIYGILRENPYRLADEVEGIGFKRADEIAIKAGIAKTNEFRVRGGILYALMQAAQEGSCRLPYDLLKSNVSSLLNIDPDEDIFENELTDLQIQGRIKRVSSENVHDDERLHENAHARSEYVYDTNLYIEEKKSADYLLRYKRLFVPNIKTTENKNSKHTKGETKNGAKTEIDSEIKKAEDELGIELDALQKKAVMHSITDGVVIITGGPGTGKTTIINTILRLFAQRGIEAVLAAPTGRAAKRMTETTGREALTIHRLLEVEAIPDSESGLSRPRFMRNADNPLEYDAVIIDEMSMVDIHLFYALLNAMTPGMRLILVGDASQLPSVGPGQVLKDLIESDCFTTITLDRIFRQEEASDIIVNAHRINRGERISLDNKSSKDFFFMKRSDYAAVKQTITQLVTYNRRK